LQLSLDLDSRSDSLPSQTQATVRYLGTNPGLRGDLGTEILLSGKSEVPVFVTR